MIFLFWFSLATLIYIYVGYPLLVGLLAKTFGKEPLRGPITPTVSLLIPAYNEAACIEAKLQNSLALDYPKSKCEIVVASDGSTDRTNEIVERFASHGVRLVSLDRNIGKAAMLSRVVPILTGDIVVFSDASGELDRFALQRIVENFADKSVGCVSGLYRTKKGDDLRSEGEGLYWKYETYIKEQEARLHSILGAHGAFYAIRKELFEPLDADDINDDYIIPMRIIRRGFRAVYDPTAFVWETESASVAGEFSRRRRIAAGNVQQVLKLWYMLSPVYGWVAFSFFSHKILRTVAPFFLIALFIASFWLSAPSSIVMISLQGLFYMSAVLGYLFQRRGTRVKWLSPSLYFCMGNLAMLEGLFKYCFSTREKMWERSR